MAEKTAAPIQLTILRQGDVNIVDLAEVGSLIARSETRVDDAFLAELAAEMQHLAVDASGSAATRQLERLGGLIFSHLLTEPARRRLRDAGPTDLHLRLDERLIHVPWELCHDGESFLATKFRVGRQVITAQPIPSPHAPRAALDRLRVLLVADPTESLRQAAAEAEHICDILDGVPGIDVTLLGGRSVRRIPLLAALEEHDIVHFAGHSHHDPSAPARSGWRLAEGVLTAGELGKVEPAPLVVFSNSCAGAATSEWDRTARYEGHAFGIGSAFLLAGVRSYVGAIWVVHDDESVLVATTWYRALAAGASLGEALRVARQTVVGAHGPRGLAWASYILYGDPTFAPLRAPDASAPLPVSPEIRAATPPEGQHRFGVTVPPDRRGTPAVSRIPVADAHVVGREAELARLDAALARADAGERTAIFVTGAPGMGKTTLVDRFIAPLRAAGDVWIAQGQSIEQFGSGEAYLPVLEAWGRLARGPEGRTVIDLLRRHAHTWLAQLPGLVDERDASALQQMAQGATRERMLREMAELIEVATAIRPLVLVLEDVHWSDHSTLDLLAYLAQRRETARLLLLTTHRPTPVMSGDHPLRAIMQELLARRRGEEMRLEPLGAADVARYLRKRLDGGDVDDALVRSVHGRTEGHPLFMVNVVDYAVQSGVVAARKGRWTLLGGPAALAGQVPDSLRQTIERQIETLAPDERTALEAASVAGAEFSIAAVAAALDTDPARLDDLCENLAWRGQLIRACGVEEWPDGTVAGRYRFVHALYRDVLYDRVAEARRVRLHRRVAERKEAAFGERCVEIAGELAAHFTAGRDAARAVRYHVQAGDVAVGRHADREAVGHYTAARRLLGKLHGAPTRATLEVELLVKLATPLMATKGYAAREVEEVFARARVLSRRVTAGPHLVPLLRGLVSFHQVRAQNVTAREVGIKLLALCERGDDPVARVQAHYGHGVTLHNLAELAAAQTHLEAAIAGYDPSTHPAHISAYGGYDPGAASRGFLAWVHWDGGFPDRALRSASDGLVLAETLGHPLTLVFAHEAAAVVRLNRHELDAAAVHVDEATALAREEGYEYQLAVCIGLDGWLHLLRGRAQDAATRLEDAVARHRATDAVAARPAMQGLLGVATAMSGRVVDGLALIDRAVDEAKETRQLLSVVSLHRIRGVLLLRTGTDDATRAEAEAGLKRALDLAGEHGATMLELQVATALARLWTAQGRTDDARALLAPRYDRFTEGLDLDDLRDARVVLGRE